MLAAMPEPGVYRFEAIDETLPYVPLAARRVLDASGRKLSLEGWLSLALEQRWRVVGAGAEDLVSAASAVLVVDEPDAAAAPRELASALGPSRPLDDPRWRALRALDRYALAKCALNQEKLARAYDEIVGTPVLSHLSTTGEARMVDVGGRPATARRAVASARVRTTRAIVDAIVSGGVAKGDVLALARVAGILAAKRTSELIPLCHPVQTTRVAIDFEADARLGELRVRATVEAVDRTGVEMEAMMAASVASLTVYDMIKSADRWASIDSVRLEAKRGGKSGEVTRPPERGSQ
jgi:molybdenum cofactor biosynthesis protein MoaC